MRRSLVLLALVLLGCAPALASSPDTERIAIYVADVIIRTDGAQVMVLLDTLPDAGTAPDGEIDQWFTLQTEEPPLPPVMVHLERATVVYRPRTLRVSTSDDGYEFVLDASKEPVAPLTTRIVGFGLAHNTGGKGPKIEDQLDRTGRVVPTCGWCVQDEP